MIEFLNFKITKNKTLNVIEHLVRKTKKKSNNDIIYSIIQVSKLKLEKVFIALVIYLIYFNFYLVILCSEVF